MSVVDGYVPGVFSQRALREVVDDMCRDIRGGDGNAMAAGLAFLHQVWMRIEVCPFTRFEIVKSGLRILAAQGDTPPIPEDHNCEMAESGYDFWLAWRNHKGLLHPRPA